MKTSIGKGCVIAALFLAAVTGAGCRSFFLADRVRDAADIITVGVGLGVGAKARVGVLRAGAFVGAHPYGLSHGEFYRRDGWDMIVEDFDLMVIGFGNDDSGRNRDKNYDVRHYPFFSVGHDILHGPRSLPPAFWTKIEVCVGAGPSVRLGFNPGEVADFVLGWFGVDIFRDDADKQRWEYQQEEIIRKEISKRTREQMYREIEQRRLETERQRLEKAKEAEPPSPKLE